MKRILILILVMVLTLGAITSCNIGKQPDSNNGGNGNNDTPATETNIEEAVKELDDMYKELNGSATENDFELVASLVLDKTEFVITWTSNKEDVKVTLVDGFWVVDVPEDVSEQFEYTLTATITTAGGQSKTLTYNRIVPGGIGVISNPEAGVAYKFALLHGNEKAVVYFDGSNYNNYAWYLAYTTDVLSAVDVYLETVEGVEGGYRLYYNKDGEKTYIVAFPRDGDTTKGTLKLDTEVPAEYYTWNTEYNTLIYTSVTGEQFFIGSSGTYKSISLSAISYLGGATNYVAHLYGPGGEPETLPEQVLPEVPENYTSQDLVDALYKLESGQTLEGPYELTGVITSIKYAYDPAYNNVSVNIVIEGRENQPVLCYRLNGGETLKVGDTITVFAGLTNYGGTYETTSGGVIRNVIEGTGTVTPPTTDSDSIVIDLTGNANLVSGSASQNVFAQNGITVTNDKAESTSDLTVQESYAQRFYAKSTVKIEYPGMTKIVIDCDEYSDLKYVKGFDGMTVEGATITRENDIVTIIFTAPTDVFQSTALPSQIRCEKITVYTGEVENPGETPVDPKPETPAYTAPVAGKSYDLYMELPTGKVYFAGSMSGDYLATTTDAAASVKIYFEVVESGYYIFFMNGDVKTYITAAAYLKSNGYAGCHFSLTTETPTLAWTYDTTYGIIEIYDEIEGKSDTFFAGTYGSYSTVSLSGAYYKDQIASGSQYPARIELVEGGDIPVAPHEHNYVNGKCACGEIDPNHTHEYVDGKCACGETDPSYVPETPVEPDDGYNTIPEVLASAEGTKVKFTGTVQSFYEDWSSYNNCSPYIVDENGNKVLVFRTTTHVYVGDVVTVEGTVTIYNTVAQIAQSGSVVTVTTPHTCDYTDATCLEASTCKSCGATAEGSVALGHTAANAEGKCDRCGLDLSVSYKEVELSFSVAGNRTSFTTSQQIWEANGIKLTNDKSASTSNVADYTNPARFYKSSKITVEYAGMTKIEFVCNSSSYATALQSSIATGTNYTVTVSGSTVTVTFVNAVDSFVIDSLTGGQVRMNSLTITAIG